MGAATDVSPVIGGPDSVDDEAFRVEARGLEPVPDEQRHGHPRELFFIWAAALADYFSFFAGAVLVGLGLGVVDAALVLVAGALAGALLLGPLSITGVRSGLPQIAYSRIAFGRRGAVIGGLFTVLIAIGWFSYDCAAAVTTAKALPVFGDAGPPGWAVWSMLAAMVAGSILVAVFGHRTITLVQTVQAPAFIALCVGIAIALWPKFNLGLTSSLEGGPHVAAMLAGFTATFALLVSWATYAADYSRYLPRRSRGVSVAFYSGGGSLVTLVVCGLLGIAVQSIDPQNQNIAQLIVTSVPNWFAWTFAAFIVVAEMSSNYMNVYTAALSCLAIGVRLLRWQAALLVGLAGGGFAAWIVPRDDFRSTYFNFLTATYVWFPAWCMVVLVDYWRRRGRVDAAEAMRIVHGWRESIRWPAVLTLLLGTGATIVFYNAQGFFVGPLARLFFHDQPADISSFVGTALSVLLFLALLRVSSRRASEAPAAPASSVSPAP
jgi:NCS1 family nucleobase:cation symporter-1